MIETLTVESVDRSHLRPTKPDRVLGQCLEDGSQVKRRTADHLEDFAGGGLLLQGLGEVTVPGLQLLEEANVLDGDHRLVGEDLQERDLLAGKRLRRRPRVDGNGSDRDPIA